MWLKRPRYLLWLERWQGHDLVKVVTGVRRSGKSTLLQMFQNQLIDQGVAPSQIISINLEDPELEADLSSGLTLLQKIKNLDAITSGETTYIFIDEAQHLAEFERTVAGLALLGNVDLYVTGSNSDFLQRDLATRLTGRYVQLHVLPLSFAEYVQDPNTEESQSAHVIERFNSYLQFGGFPYVQKLGSDEAMIREYLNGVLNTVLLKDIAARQTTMNPSTLNAVVDFMFDNVGNLASIKRISDTLTSAGRKIGRSAVESYVVGMTDAYLLYEVPRFDLKGKLYLSSNPKYYLVDTGLRRARLGSRHADLGHLLENVIYLELKRRYESVYVGKLGAGEIDFVVEAGGDRAYFQVAFNVDDPATLARELAPLQQIGDHYPRTLLVADQSGRSSYDGIARVNVTQWLLDV